LTQPILNIKYVDFDPYLGFMRIGQGSRSLLDLFGAGSNPAGKPQLVGAGNFPFFFHFKPICAILIDNNDIVYNKIYLNSLQANK
jgi:hypothetical protein